MPTYDYDCSNGHRFEVVQKMTDDPVARCPECDAPAQRRISGGAGFLFKGEGFYITDYRSEDYKKRAAEESGDSSKKAAKSKADGAPDAKSKAKNGSESGGSKDTKTASES